MTETHDVFVPAVRGPSHGEAKLSGTPIATQTHDILVTATCGPKDCSVVIGGFQFVS